MKNYTLLVYTGLILSILGSNACSTGEKAGERAEAGPTILTARSEPGTIELNRDLQPIQDPKVVADVKDFRSEVTDVMLHFENVPISVPMENIGGNTWEARLNSRQLEMMAVSGQTAKYDAHVIAKNAEGEVTTGERPVEIAVKAPELSRPATL